MPTKNASIMSKWPPGATAALDGPPQTPFEDCGAKVGDYLVYLHNETIWMSKIDRLGQFGWEHPEAFAFDNFWFAYSYWLKLQKEYNATGKIAR